MGMASIQFKSRSVGLIGVLGGAAIAIGLPAVVLLYGAMLGTAFQAILVILALVGGGIVAWVGAFFGIVMPMAGRPGHWHFSHGFRGVKGSGVAAISTREVPAFEAIRVDGSVNVEAVAGEKQSLTLECDDNLLELIRTEVVNGVLVVKQAQPYSTTLGVVVKVAAPALKSACVSGSGDVCAKNISGKAFEVSIRGSGDVEAEGRVDALRVSITGSGDAGLQDLVCKNAEVKIAGSGDANVHAEESLKVSIAGSGDVAYHGFPTVEKRIHGSGSVCKA